MKVDGLNQNTNPKKKHIWPTPSMTGLIPGQMRQKTRSNQILRNQIQSDMGRKRWKLIRATTDAIREFVSGASFHARSEIGAVITSRARRFATRELRRAASDAVCETTIPC